jgi:prefoldin subunit 5
VKSTQTKKSSSIARLANALLVARVLVSNVNNTLSWTFPGADDKFKTELNATLKPLQAINSNFDCAIQDIASDIERISSHHETVEDDVDKMLSQAETKLKTLFEQLLAKLQQYKVTAKLTIRQVNSEHMDKLKTSLAETQKRAHNIQQHKATIEQHLASTSTVFDRFKVVKQLSEIQSETSRTQAKRYQPETIRYDTSKWQNDMTAWLHDISGALITA